MEEALRGENNPSHFKVIYTKRTYMYTKFSCFWFKGILDECIHVDGATDQSGPTFLEENQADLHI